MINKPPPFKGLNIRIPIVTPIKGKGFINQGSGLLRFVPWSCRSPSPQVPSKGHIPWIKDPIPRVQTVRIGIVEDLDSLRVQVPNNHILTQNLYYNYYCPVPKYRIIGCWDPKP